MFPLAILSIVILRVTNFKEFRPAMAHPDEEGQGRGEPFPFEGYAGSDLVGSYLFPNSSSGNVCKIVAVFSMSKRDIV